MISRILAYFSTWQVLLFSHSNVYVHAIWFNIQNCIFGIVNTFFYFTHLPWLFISLWSLHPSLPSFCDYLYLILRSLVILLLSEEVTEFPKNVFWFPCWKSFSEECSSSGLLPCNCFSFLITVFPDYSFLNEKKKGQFQIHSHAGCVDFTWFYWLDTWVMMEFSQIYRLITLVSAQFW